MRKSKTQKGITLVALITTVIVLCILAATAIGTISKDGLISKSQDASDKHNQALKDDEAFMQEGESILDEVLGGVGVGGSSNSAPESVFLWKSNDRNSPDYGTVIGYTANIDNYPSLRFPNRCKKITVEFTDDLDEDTRREMRSYTANIREIELPETVVEIGAEAFAAYEFSNLKKINIPNGVEIIGDKAFCCEITSINIPKSVTSIGFQAFQGCANLTTIIYSGTTTEWNEIELDSQWNLASSIQKIICTDGDILILLQVISDGQYNYQLSQDETYYIVDGNYIMDYPTAAEIPSTQNTIPVKEIGDEVFSGNENLVSVVIPNTIEVIGDRAFAGCINLTTITFNGTVEEWNQIELGTDWNYFCAVTEVICSNGTISLLEEFSAIKNEAGNNISNKVVTKNTTAYDEYGNKIVVPAGFKIRVDSSTNYADNVTKGIVIEHGTDGNQFVWVPVGKIYTDTAKTESLAKTITLGRYESFEATNGVYTPAQTAENYATATTIYQYTEDTASNHNSRYENVIARDIGAFVTSAIGNAGYYIGRFEAGNSNDTLVCKYNQIVYNNITQPDASSVCQSMYVDGYSSGTFSSDLINSYAWDTAIIFIQIFGTKSNSSSYASTAGLSAISTYESQKTGKNILDATGSIDEQLNIFDMAGNCREWSTESASSTVNSCVYRGGDFLNINLYTKSRLYDGATLSHPQFAFRPLIYVGL